MNLNKRLAQIIILALLILVFGFIFLRSNLKINVNSNSPKRVIYNFNKIINSKFLSFANKAVGFSIEYPEDMKIYEYNSKQDKRYINLSLASQTAEGTELFDGLSIDFTYYKNNNNFSLEAIIPQKTTNKYPQEGDIISREKTLVNNIEMIKVFKCCWGGGSTIYYVLTKKGEYVLEIDILSVGSEKEKFNKVADKIIQSFKYTP